MTFDDFIRLVQACTALVAAVAWPLVVLFVLVRFTPALKDFLLDLGELSFKGGGFEASARRVKEEVKAGLVAAEVGRTAEAAPTLRQASQAASAATDAVNTRTIRRAQGATALWVDDRPDNNRLERQSFETLGMSFVLATSTEEALRETARRKFDVIISDMGRPPDARAGYTLLRALRERGDTTPYVIYAGSNAAAHQEEARRAGALGATNRASELFALVLSALDGRA
ncbi:response regulator [Pseudoduganella buxea]|uniref:Response regulator n=1 Tax=Pseudoduganella buxea TaxID=1949069 RepID=A0A6I3SWP4_9BURK|nr:response regulator [Pseudoduganella buxea]MTV53125.1 response regulator [Pseudoduganella buxea]GGB85194.1 response regulator [Pseudoduganella buxea]